MADETKILAVLTRKEVAEILAVTIARVTGEYVVNPVIEINGYDIVLRSDVVE